jgi:hypothetical protein
VSGAKTAERYCLIDMLMSTGGPPPHRRDFEEMFTVPEGEPEFTFRGVSKRFARELPSIFRQALRIGSRTVLMLRRALGPKTLRTGNEVQPSEQSCF